MTLVRAQLAGAKSSLAFNVISRTANKAAAYSAAWSSAYLGVGVDHDRQLLAKVRTRACTHAHALAHAHAHAHAHARRLALTHTRAHMHACMPKVRTRAAHARARLYALELRRSIRAAAHAHARRSCAPACMPLTELRRLSLGAPDPPEIAPRELARPPPPRRHDSFSRELAR